MRFFCLLILFAYSSSFAQDIIYLNSDKKIDANIIAANDENFQYKNRQNPSGPTYTVARSEIQEINFKNGVIEVFRDAPPPSSLSIEQVKTIIIEKINTFAFDGKSETRRYRASFEGDYLKLWIMRSRGDEPYSKPILFDFSRVYDFQDISYRANESYINIFVDFLDKKGNLDKEKLVIRVLEKDQALQIVNILKIYNRMLAEKNIGTASE